MNVLIVGNILKDVYLNLDSRTENFENDKNGVKWLDFSFDASEHHFFSRNSSLGGAAVSLEVLQKFGISAAISDSRLDFNRDDFGLGESTITHRYILVSDGQVSYLAPSSFCTTTFTPPAEAVDYLYIDRSAELDMETTKKILAYLEVATKTKLVLYARNFENRYLIDLLPRADLIFSELLDAPELEGIETEKVIVLAEDKLIYQGIVEKVSTERVDMITHLSLYSVAAATILGSFILGSSVEKSLKRAKINVENSKLDAVLGLAEIDKIVENSPLAEDIELVAANLVLKPKGILAIDESEESIEKKFGKLGVENSPEKRREWRNLLLTTPELEQYINGVILHDETTQQMVDDGQNFVNYLIYRRIVPGVKVDQGLEHFPHSQETYTKGLESLSGRLKEYYTKGLRFAKWRAVFKLQLDNNRQPITPTAMATRRNCQDLARFALICQDTGMVPVVEIELSYDGDYDISECAEVTGKILDDLFAEIEKYNVNLAACVLKVNMVMAGKQFDGQSEPSLVGSETAKVLKEHVPAGLAGVVLLSGGQSPEQATLNLAEILKNGPFPWPVTFSFARALQDPAFLAWAGSSDNTEKAKSAFLERLIVNCEALKEKN